MAGLDDHTIRAIAVCAVFFLAVVGCIVVAMLEHQRKMAALMRSDRQQTEGLDQRVDALQQEIRELKSMLAPKSSEEVNDTLPRRIS